MTVPVRVPLKPVAMAAVAAAVFAFAVPAEARDEVRVPSLTAPFGAASPSRW